MNFPTLIKDVRQSLGETQAEFAARFDTQANTVSRWESGQYQAPYAVLDFVLTGQKPADDFLFTCWANEPGRKLHVSQGSCGRVYFSIVDEVNVTRWGASIEKHHVKNLAEILTKLEER